MVEGDIDKICDQKPQEEKEDVNADISLIDIGDSVYDSGFYSIIADECTDCSNKEQFTINIR